MPEIQDIYNAIKEQDRNGKSRNAESATLSSAQDFATDKLSFASSKTVNSHLRQTSEPPKPIIEITPEIRRSFETNKVISLLEEIVSLQSDKSKI